MTETNTMYYEILDKTRNTINNLSLCDNDGYTWRFRYYGVDYMLMYMPSANMTYIHTAYHNAGEPGWRPGRVVAYFYGMPHEYDFTKELNADGLKYYREQLAEVKEELNNVANNYSYFVQHTREFADELDHSDSVIKKFVDWLYVY